MSISSSQPPALHRRMSVSVVVLAKNGVASIGACLDSVLSQDYAGDVETLVIDSGSTDGTIEEVLQRPEVHLHQIPPEAFDHGDTRNLGAGMTTGQAIVFLVQDAEPANSDWLGALVSNLEDDPEVAGAFSRILPRPESSPLIRRSSEGDLCFGSERVEVKMESLEAWSELDPHTLRNQCNFNNVSSAIRRSVWEQLPLQRSAFGEDIKFARSAIEAGWRIVFEPRSRVWHSHEYGLIPIYRRTRIDADLNMRYLGRVCVERLRHVWVMMRRAWREDRAYLRRLGLSSGKRFRWNALSPLHRLAEFLGFWRGGRGALRTGACAGRRTPAAQPCSDRRLKILFVVHGFPPENWAGVEVLSLTLARALRRRGHEIVVFTRSPGTPTEADRSLHESHFDEFRVHRYVNRLVLSGVDETYRLADAEEAFEHVLLKERPDVVHIFHMIHLSTGIIDRCRAHNIPSVVSLWDFWARCPRVQLIRPNKRNCTIPPPGVGCIACVYERPGLVDLLAKLDRLLRPLPSWWAARVPQSARASPTGWRRLREDTASLVRRERWMREVLLRADSLVVASVTLKHALEGLGIPAQRICMCQHGVATGWLGEGPSPPSPRDAGEPLRVGFIASLVWYKGLSVAARAVASMPPGTVHLHVYGDHTVAPDPATAAMVQQVASEASQTAQGRITFHGRFAHDEMAAVHSNIDVLVVPSLWQEAYGLTVREAHLSGTPVVGSNIGGIAEGIRHGVDGLLFEPGDAAALRGALEQLVVDPTLGPRLAAAAPRVRTDDEEASEMEWRYRQVIGNARAGVRYR